METATIIAAFAGLILAIINLIWLISGNFIKTFVSCLKLIKETSENEEKIFKSAASDRDWFNLDCDPEGPTKEQEKEQDLFLENVAKEVLNCK